MTPETRSRRDRPAKPALSRGWIIAETIAIMAADGLEKATVRRVAQALDTGPASLYAYFTNTAELHAAVLDELLGPVLDTVPAGGSAPWSERLEQVLRAYGGLLFRHPGLARSALLLRPVGPHALRLYDTVLGLLLDGGCPAERAAWGVDLLLQHVTADAAEHAAPSSGDIDAPADDAAEWRALSRAVRSADPARTPHLAANAHVLLSGSPDQRASWAVRALVAGIVDTATPAEADRPSPTTTGTEQR